MNINSTIGISLIIVVISALLKKYSPEFFVIFLILSSAFLLSFAIPYVQKIINEIDELINISCSFIKFKSTIIKILGICTISQIASDICKDSGNISIANNISLFGKISILVSCIPMFRCFFDTILDIFKGLDH